MERNDVRGVWQPQEFQLAESIYPPTIPHDSSETLYTNQCLINLENL